MDLRKRRESVVEELIQGA